MNFQIARTPLSRPQITGFWAAWTGWTLDGMDSFIYALVLSPALTELLPKSGMASTPGNVGFVGSVMFAIFLVGWGLAFIWGPIADRFGRVRVLAASVLVYAVFTGAVNFTVGAHYGWRAMFLCGLAPAALSLYVVLKVKEPERWKKKAEEPVAKARSPLAQIFNPQYRRRTVVNAALLTVAIIGLWAGAVYEPTAVIALAKQEGMKAPTAVRVASMATALLSVGTILGCLALPPLAERMGRRKTLGLYFIGMAVCIFLSFGWAFYLHNGLVPFVVVLFFLGFFGGNFAMFSLWLPEQYSTSVRATAFAFTTSFGRFIGAGVNFLLGSMIHSYGSIGVPVATTAIAFILGLLVIPFARETKGMPLPE
jgi:MFS family permease